MKKLPYEDGTWFAVPLRNGGYGTGVVARHSQDGVVLIYLFGPKRSKPAELGDVERLSKAHAVRVCMAGDLGLMEGSWPIIGKGRLWAREDWPMPKFLRKDELGGAAWLVTYADDNPNHVIREERVSPDMAGFERDALSGAGAVEIVMTQLLC
jgi:hypothetical protein